MVAQVGDMQTINMLQNSLVENIRGEMLNQADSNGNTPAKVLAQARQHSDAVAAAV